MENETDPHPQADEREEAIGGVFNVAGGFQTSILHLAAALNQVLGTDLAPTFAPARAGEVRFSQGAASRAQEVLGWKAQASLQEGLSQLIEAEYKIGVKHETRSE